MRAQTLGEQSGGQAPFSSRAHQGSGGPRSAAHRAGGRPRPQVREAVELALAQEELGQLAHAVQSEFELQRRQRLLVDEFGVHAAQGVHGRRRGRGSRRRLQARGTSRSAGGRGRAAGVHRRHGLQVRAAGGRWRPSRKGLKGRRRPESPVRQGPRLGRRRAQRSPPWPQPAVQACARVRLQRPERLGAVGGHGGRRSLHQAVTFGEHQVVGHDGGLAASGDDGRTVSAGGRRTRTAVLLQQEIRVPCSPRNPAGQKKTEPDHRFCLCPDARTQSSGAPVAATRGGEENALARRSSSETSAPPRVLRALYPEAGLPRSRALIGWMRRAREDRAAPPGGLSTAPVGAPPFGPPAALQARSAALCWVFSTFPGSWSECPRLSLGTSWAQADRTRGVGSQLQDHKPNLLIFQVGAQAQ